LSYFVRHDASSLSVVWLVSGEHKAEEHDTSVPVTIETIPPNSVKNLKFRTHFFEVIEELRMRRVCGTDDQSLWKSPAFFSVYMFFENPENNCVEIFLLTCRSKSSSCIPLLCCCARIVWTCLKLFCICTQSDRLNYSELAIAVCSWQVVIMKINWSNCWMTNRCWRTNV